MLLLSGTVKGAVEDSRSLVLELLRGEVALVEVRKGVLRVKLLRGELCEPRDPDALWERLCCSGDWLRDERGFRLLRLGMSLGIKKLSTLRASRPSRRTCSCTLSLAWLEESGAEW
jgi:hypothetical protein